ncbi:MAG TPA: hypothetical protein DCQ31_08575, partial [Bacteroidales bacterium]|nr:hypothetical protein [Bacteroidales bacterium]
MPKQVYCFDIKKLNSKKMSEKHGIMLDTWERKAHYEFFTAFSDPFFGITVNVDFTEGYRRASELNCSYFLFYLYCSLAAANKIESFRYRIENG